MIKRFLKKSRILLLILLASILFAILFTLVIDYFRVKKIELSGAKSILGISVLNNKVIFLMREKSLERQLLSQNPSIESVIVKKQLPDRLQIDVIQSGIIAQLEASHGWFMLSSQGRVLAKRRNPIPNIARINYFTKYPFETYKVGDTIDSDEIKYTSYFLNRLRTLNLIDGTQVDITHLFVIVCRNKSQEFWFTTKKSKEDQFTALKTIVNGFKNDGRKLKKIDLRFSKPLITLEKDNSITP